MAELEDLGKAALGLALGASLAADLGFFEGVNLPTAQAGAVVDLPLDAVHMVSQVTDLAASGVVNASVALAFQIAQLGIVIAALGYLFKKGLGLDK